MEGSRLYWKIWSGRVAYCTVRSSCDWFLPRNTESSNAVVLSYFKIPEERVSISCWTHRNFRKRTCLWPSWKRLVFTCWEISIHCSFDAFYWKRMFSRWLWISRSLMSHLYFKHWSFESNKTIFTFPSVNYCAEILKVLKGWYVIIYCRLQNFLSKRCGTINLFLQTSSRLWSL